MSFISQMGLYYTDIAVVTACSGSRPPHLAPWLGGTPPFGPFIILNFVTAPTALIYIFLSYFLDYPPLTNSTTGTSYTIADRFQHERANSLAETLH